MSRLSPLMVAAGILQCCTSVAPGAQQDVSVDQLNASQRIACVWKKGTAKEALRVIDQAGLTVVYTGKHLPFGVCTGHLTEEALKNLLNSSIQSVEPDIDLIFESDDEPPARQVDAELLNAYEHAGRLVCVWNQGKKKEALAEIKKIDQLRVVYAPEKLPLAICDWQPPLREATLRALMAADNLKYVEPDVQLLADKERVGRVIDYPTGTPRSTRNAEGRTETLPEDPEIRKLWGMRNIKAPLAWSCATSSPVVVAVIDSGIDNMHADLKANLWVNQAEQPGNKKDDDGNGFVDDFYGLNFTTLPPTADTMDRYGHGSHVAGIIGAVGNNKIGIAGVNWRVQLMGLKVFNDSGQAPRGTSLAAAIDYALARQAKIINLSLRWNTDRKFLKLAVDGAEKDGVIIVCAAGNLYPGEDAKTLDNDAIPHYPASFPNENVIAVANLTELPEGLHPTSHFGARTVDLAAPGTDIYSTVPLKIVASGYASYTGTSMATPHVTGALALLWGQPRFSALGYKAIRSMILDHTRKIKSLVGRCATGGALDLEFLCGGAEAGRSRPVQPGGAEQEPVPEKSTTQFFVPGPPNDHNFYWFRARGYH